MLEQAKKVAVVAFAAVSLGGSAPDRTPAALDVAAEDRGVRLEPGEHFDRPLELPSGRYLELAATQLEGDISVAILGPSGERLAASDLPGRRSLEERVAVVTERSGVYTARVGLAASAESRARFELATVALRRASKLDQERLEGLRLFQDGQRLFEMQTETSSWKAIEGFERAAALFERARARLWHGRALRRMADALRHVGETERARDAYARAVAVLEVASGAELVEALWRYGVALLNLGEAEEGLGHCESALALSRKLGAKDLEASSLNAIAVHLIRSGRTREAAARFEEIVALRRELGDRENLATNLGNLGVAYRFLGRSDEALAAYDEALELALALDPDGEEVNNLYSNYGVVYNMRGEVRLAIDSYEKARTLARRRGDLDSLATASYNEGMVYRKLGEPVRARALFDEALELSRKTSSPREGRVLQALGALLADAGNYESALEYLTLARERNAAMGSRAGEAEAALGIGRCRLARGDVAAAREAFDEARAIQVEISDRRGLSSTLGYLSVISGESGAFDEARRLIDEALELALEVSDRSQEASAREQRAAVLERSGEIGEAREELELSIGIVESLRGDLIRPDLRATFFAGSHERYVRLARLIQRAGGDAASAAAFEVSERARARSLAERIWESNERLGKDGDPALVGRRRELLARLSASQYSLTLTLREADPDPVAVVAQRDAVEGIYRSLQDVERDLRRSDPRWQTLSYPAPVTARAARELMSPGTALLSYLLGPEDSFLFVITDREVQALSIPGEDELLPLVQEVRRLLEKPGRRSLGRLASASRELYELLMAPAEPFLAGRERLVIVPDGSLHYLPFEVLIAEDLTDGATPAGASYLVSRWGISYAPSVSVLSSLRLRRSRVAGGGVDWVAFADPTLPGSEAATGDGPVLRGLGDQSSWRWRRLAGARAEVERIAGLFPPGKAVVFTDARAEERVFKATPEVGRARYLHFASHALVDSRTPDLSAVLLAPSPDGAEDGLLQAHEILDLDLVADLVVLSGCETALGREVRGEGLVGLTQAFLFAGARAVSVSLWPVEDGSTGTLMLRFYEGVQRGEDPVEALRQAKLQQLSSPGTAHPYYWAPFVLMGAPG